MIDPIDYLLDYAAIHTAPRMLATLRLIQNAPFGLTWDDLLAQDHSAGLYLPALARLRWIQPDRCAPDMSGRRPRWRISPHALGGDMGTLLELLEELRHE